MLAVIVGKKEKQIILINAKRLNLKSLSTRTPQQFSLLSEKTHK